MFNMYAQAIRKIPYKTELADTEIFNVVEPFGDMRVVITRLMMLNLSTAKTLTILPGFSKVIASAEAAAAQKVVNISADPGVTATGGIAANDYCIIRLTDGSYQLNKVASVDTLEITFTDNWSSIVEKSAPIWFYGAVVNNDEAYEIEASAEVEMESEHGFFIGAENGYPLILHIDNATDVCKIMGGTVIHVQG